MASCVHVVVITAFFLVSVTAKQFNVLFLAADDMRPQLGAYQGPDFPSLVKQKMHTPNLDKLAGRSLLLKRAYVQQAVCSPSRASSLTGRRPDTTRVHDMLAYWRKVGGDFTTIPQYFKQHGYRTTGMGKIFHPGPPSGGDDPISWTDPYFHASQSSHWAGKGSVTWHMADVNDTKKYPLTDMTLASHAVETLRNISQQALSGDQPFFMAVGFHRPHLPFLIPANFFEYYPEDEVAFPDNQYAPVNMPQIAWADFDELRDYGDIALKYGFGAINTTLPQNVVRGLRRAYYAAVSYTDSLVGQVLDELERLGLDDSTIVSFWGDHGWQLGEHGEWCKQSNFEIATHAPMMVRVPGLTDKGIVAEQLTEFVDLFPTLAEAAGLPSVPLCPENSSKIETCVEGVSLMPLMKDPTRKWKDAVFSQFPRMAVDGTTVMGYTMRTDRYRYTEWVRFDNFNFVPHWYQNFGRGTELYDHEKDPEENWNHGHEKEYEDLRKELSDMLHKGWRSFVPSSDTDGFPEIETV